MVYAREKLGGGGKKKGNNLVRVHQKNRFEFDTKTFLQKAIINVGRAGVFRITVSRQSMDEPSAMQSLS